MPYLLPHPSTVDKKLLMVLAFGNLSYLEACSVLGGRLLSSSLPWEDVAIVELKDARGGYENLAGVHKVAISITPNPRARLDDIAELDEFLGGLDDGFNFSISLYSPEAVGEAEYEEVLSTILSVVREAGFRKANLVRPRNGTEVLTREISSRKIIDFVVLRLGEKYLLGATIYVPDARQFQVRSNERPVVSSQISISARLGSSSAEPQRRAQGRRRSGSFLRFGHDPGGSSDGGLELHGRGQGPQPHREQQAEPGVALQDVEGPPKVVFAEGGRLDQARNSDGGGSGRTRS